MDSTSHSKTKVPWQAVQMLAVALMAWWAARFILRTDELAQQIKIWQIMPAK